MKADQLQGDPPQELTTIRKRNTKNSLPRILPARNRPTSPHLRPRQILRNSLILTRTRECHQAPPPAAFRTDARRIDILRNKGIGQTQSKWNCESGNAPRPRGARPIANRIRNHRRVANLVKPPKRHTKSRFRRRCARLRKAKKQGPTAILKKRAPSNRKRNRKRHISHRSPSPNRKTSDGDRIKRNDEMTHRLVPLILLPNRAISAIRPMVGSRSPLPNGRVLRPSSSFRTFPNWSVTPRIAYRFAQFGFTSWPAIDTNEEETITPGQGYAKYVPYFPRLWFRKMDSHPAKNDPVNGTLRKPAKNIK